MAVVPWSAANWSAEVAGADYIDVALIPLSDDFTVIATDADYFKTPVAVGDAVPLSWGLEDAVLLGRVAA